MSAVETVKVKREGGKGYKLINKSDFDPRKHKLVSGGKVGDDGLTEDERQQLAELEAKRRREANRGQVDGGGFGEGRNTSGTFSEPTPTDIRFPDKNATEFENNHGAFVDKSAAGLREDMGLPDAPGGIEPVSDVEIPEDWASLHWQKQVKLAEEIGGKSGLSAGEAREVIEAEVKRRAAAPQA